MENFARNSKRKFLIAKISLGLRNFRYAIAKCTVLSAGSYGYCSIGHCSLHPILQLAIFLQFFSCFEILHSWLAEIDMRPYEIDGNQPDFGYDWIDTIIWPQIPAKTTKTASE